MKEAAKTLVKIDEKIKAISDAYRAKINNGVVPGQPLPDIPAKLTVLKNEREEFLTELPGTLESKMGTASYQKLKTFVEEEIAPRIRPIIAADIRNTNAPQPSSPLQP